MSQISIRVKSKGITSDKVYTITIYLSTSFKPFTYSAFLIFFFLQLYLAMDQIFYGPRLFTEEDIPGSSLSGRKPSVLKNPELKFWLKCRGDSCKGLKTKAQLVKGK